MPDGESMLPAIAVIPSCDVCSNTIRNSGASFVHACPIAAWVAANKLPVAKQAAIEAMESSLARENKIRRINVSGIKPVLRSDDRRRVIDGPLENTQALERTRLWLVGAMRSVDPDRNILVLAGNPGTGKTLAAAWALATAGGRYVTTEEYLRSYSRWHRDVMQQDLTSRELERFEGSGLVVLDEIGTERDATLMRDGLHRLVDRRQSRRRQLTIMITNLTRDDFIARLSSGVYDPRTLDRMKRDAIVVGVREGSMRGGELGK